MKNTKLRTIEPEELKQILENHVCWLRGDREEWSTMRAELCRADLRGASLALARLNAAFLHQANLSGAILRKADLSLADLYESNLHNANLHRSILRDADLRGADLRDADLSDADLRGANLQRADLRGADLQDADLRGADLQDARLCGADSFKADLRGADLRGATGLDRYAAALLMACPEEGSFIGWKKCEGFLVKLLIPEDAKRSSATTRKCRCSHAKVLGIYDILGNPTDFTELDHSAYGHITTYRVGQIVRPDDFDEYRWNECSNGIHFFITKQEAINY